MPKIYEKAKKSKNSGLTLDHKIMEVVCFLADIHQWNIAFSVVHVQVCLKSLFFY